jgi:hypothetical protein
MSHDQVAVLLRKGDSDMDFAGLLLNIDQPCYEIADFHIKERKSNQIVVTICEVTI